MLFALSPRAMRRVLVTFFLTVAAAACRPPDTSTVNAAVGFTVPSLTFSRTLLGRERTQTVTVENRGRGAALLSFSAQGRFSVTPEVLDVRGGSTGEVRVTFHPLERGEATGLLEASGVDRVAPVVLSGEGVQEEACVASSPCMTAVFDPERAACVETPVSDGAACASPSTCVPQGQCISGVCKGNLDTCDDGNKCTTDACAMAEGCVHFDASDECPASDDACQAPVCDPKMGCGLVEVADGTPCGASDCNRADLCMAGTCTSVAVPEGAACGAESPCQAKGVCRAKACDQPVASKLQEAWHYEVPPPFQLQFQGVADALGNLYAVECFNGGDYAASECRVLSFHANGVLRFRVALPLQAWQTPGRVEPLQLLAGNVFVFSPNPAELFAVSATDGHLLWQWPELGDGVVQPGRISLQAMAAGSDGSLWVVANRDYPEKPQPLPPTERVLSVFNATDGALRWSHTQTDRVGESIVLDASNRGYLTVGGSGDSTAAGRVLQAYSSTGPLRWSRTVPIAARAVFNGRIELANGKTLATADGADKWLSDWLIERADELMHSPLMTTGGIFEPMFLLIDDAEAAFTGEIPAFDALAVAFRSNPNGALQYGQYGPTVLAPTLTAASDMPVPVTTLSLTDRKLAVLSGQAGPGVDLQWLRGIDMAGKEAFACELPVDSAADTTTYFGISTLLDGRWAALAHRECLSCVVAPPERLVVFHTPGLRPAQRGWTAAFGNATRDNRER